MGSYFAMEVACDFCGEGQATVYCRADSARLCLSCDRHVHSANALSERHSRTLLCQGCNIRPAGVRCPSCQTCFCQPCDDDTHNSSILVSQHKRHDLTCFIGCPSATELAALWACDDRSECRDIDGPLASQSSSRLLGNSQSAGSTATKSTVEPCARESQRSGANSMESSPGVAAMSNITNVGHSVAAKVASHVFIPFSISHLSSLIFTTVLYSLSYKYLEEVATNS